jgi:hypothetical protein
MDAKKWGCQTINKVDVAHKGNSIRRLAGGGVEQ